MAYEPDTKLRDLRKNGQVVQPDVENMPDDNGWPKPLTDPSTPYKIGVTNGKNGEQSNVDPKISQDSWSLTEGKSGGAATPEADGQDGQRAGDESTSQKIFSDPSGTGASAPAKQWQDEGDGGGRGNSWDKTSQQVREEHHDPEGEN